MTRPKPPEGATARITIVLPAEALERVKEMAEEIATYPTRCDHAAVVAGRTRPHPRPPGAHSQRPPGKRSRSRVMCGRAADVDTRTRVVIGMVEVGDAR